MKLTFRQEIPRWDEGLPLGNGALGALICAYDVLHICGKTAAYAPQRGYVPLPFEKDMGGSSKG